MNKPKGKGPGKTNSITVTIAAAILLAFFGWIDRRLARLDDRVRTVEQQVTAIATHLGITRPTRPPTAATSQPRGDDPPRIDHRESIL